MKVEVNSKTNRFAARYNNFDDNADFYPTPPEATEALMAREKFEGLVWECACGNGAMSEVIKKYNKVQSTDLVDRGYGELSDFFHDNRLVSNIITNPPYKYAEKFLLRALELADKKIAFLLRLTFLESAKRKEIFQKFPPKVVYIFSKRVPIYKNGIVGNSGMVAYAWYIWEKGFEGEPIIRWI
jgi:hypothetical protein